MSALRSYFQHAMQDYLHVDDQARQRIYEDAQDDQAARETERLANEFWKTTDFDAFDLDINGDAEALGNQLQEMFQDFLEDAQTT